MVLQIHETGRIEGNGHRWASVLVILSDEFVVVCMSFYVILPFGLVIRLAEA